MISTWQYSATTRALVICSVALACLQACSNESEIIQASQSIEAFHRLYNESSFDRIYDETDEAFRKGTTRAEWNEFASAVRRKLGRHQGSSKRGSKAQRRPEGTVVIVSAVSIFEHGKAGEDFVLLVGKGQARLVEYNINSRVLVIR